MEHPGCYSRAGSRLVVSIASLLFLVGLLSGRRSVGTREGGPKKKKNRSFVGCS